MHRYLCYWESVGKVLLDTVHSMSYSAYTVGVVTIDQTAVKTHTVNPTMLARGHLLLEAGGPVWVSSRICYNILGHYKPLFSRVCTALIIIPILLLRPQMGPL